MLHNSYAFSVNPEHIKNHILQDKIVVCWGVKNFAWNIDRTPLPDDEEEIKENKTNKEKVETNMRVIEKHVWAFCDGSDADETEIISRLHFAWPNWQFTLYRESKHVITIYPSPNRRHMESLGNDDNCF